MLTHTTKWSHPPGNPVVPSRWQATREHARPNGIYLSWLAESARTYLQMPGTVRRAPPSAGGRGTSSYTTDVVGFVALASRAHRELDGGADRQRHTLPGWMVGEQVNAAALVDEAEVSARRTLSGSGVAIRLRGSSAPRMVQSTISERRTVPENVFGPMPRGIA